MSKKYVLKDITSGLLFVVAQGFVAEKAENANQYDSAEEAQKVIDAIKLLDGGAPAATIQIVEFVPAPTATANGTGSNPYIKQNEDGTSFAVSFIRPKDLNPDGSIKSHRLNPSKRRFRTKAEAVFHGSRFTRIEGHLGFYVTTTKDPVNAFVNVVTGKTNPVIGRGRTNRE
jgi:hypothetical protein